MYRTVLADVKPLGAYHLPMHLLASALCRAVETGLLPRGARILLAVSGGADSTALLHAAAENAPANGWLLTAAHVHHGWRGREADRDLAFVKESARRLAIPF